MQAVVIGSGLSGLTAAAYLARGGHEVSVFEQYPQIGGVTATLKREGYGWDLGPLLLEGFGPGDSAHRILTDLGVADRVRTLREDRGICFPDFALWKPEIYRGPYWRRERMKALFSDEAEGLDRYYRFYDRMTDLMTLAGRSEAATGAAALLLKLRAWLAFRKVRGMADWSAEKLLDHFFHRPELKAIFSGILADFVVLPSEFPGLGIPGCNPETSFDRRIPLQLNRAGSRAAYYYVIGGIGKVVEALADAISANGGKIETGVPVEKILIEGRKVRGVRLADGREAGADVVLASGGAKETLYRLVGKEHLSAECIRGVEALQPMESVLMVHLGVDAEVAERQPAALCYYYGSYDIDGSVRACREGRYHEGKDGFLIYVPSMHSPELAPPGRHAVTIYTIAPNRLREGSWQSRREELADKLVAEAERFVPGLREHTHLRVVMTPEDFQQRTHLAHHGFGGISPVMGKENPAHQTDVDGLWFIGAQSESGGGVVGVMKGSRKVARRILSAD